VFEEVEWDNKTYKKGSLVCVFLMVFLSVVVVAQQLFSNTKKSEGGGIEVVCSRCAGWTVIEQRCRHVETCRPSYNEGWTGRLLVLSSTSLLFLCLLTGVLDVWFMLVLHKLGQWVVCLDMFSDFPSLH